VPQRSAGSATPLADQASEAILGANPFVGIDAGQVIGEGARSVARRLRPGVAAGALSRTARELGDVLAGRSQVRPAEGDRRFTDVAWTENPAYRRLMQGYLALVSAGHRLVDESGLSDVESQRAHFAVTLLADALAPTNGLLTNPAAVKRAFDTGGVSLLRGARHLVGDLRSNGGMPATVDKSAFEVGRTVATSAGAVVHRSQVLELIQYRPSTDSVLERPLLVIPPQINKFYVLDIAPGRSFVEHAVAQGIPLFTISWRNPSAAQRDWGLDAYVDACLKAIDVVSEISGADAVNVLGLCAGGVTMAMVLQRASKISSATFAVSMLDFKAPSLVGTLASDAVIATALRRSRAKGVLEGSEMARVFAWMRPNDLVWNYWVNNYLLGHEPPAFDILFWNADHTRLPAALHADFLDLYVRNPLVESPHLKQFSGPSYVVAGMTDHIVPWKAAYRTTQLLGGKPEFVLSSSGHIQSIVNPPGNPKASYFAGGDACGDADAWLSSSAEVKGSWWQHWTGWVSKHSGDRRPAPRSLGSSRHRARGKAPGKYVLEH
jgi:polyhydroxyalkanoate synthase